MTQPVLEFVTAHTLDNAATGDFLPVYAALTVDGAAAFPDELPQEVRTRLDEVAKAVGFTGEAERFVRVPLGDAAALLLGLGEEATPGALRNAAGALTRQLTDETPVALFLPIETEDDVLAAATGALLGGYRFNAYFGETLGRQRKAPERVLIVTELGTDQLLQTAVESAAAVARVKDFVNTPARDLAPEDFATRMTELADLVGVDVEVWDEQRLEAEGCGGIVGVGAGSVRPPRLVKFSWNPEGAGRHLALVGKGITFDSGGLSLKPPMSMNGMKYDMTGAATAGHTVLAAAALGLPVRMTAWMCLAENMPSGSATRPGDVLKLRNGITVEVTNTDAEGRLVLADGLSLASEEHPDAIIDIATLTGAATVALGTRHVAVMGDAELAAQVSAAGERAGEDYWYMPLPGYMKAQMKSDIADLLNANLGNRGGGMLFAGVFLEYFVGEGEHGRIPWAHLDIAGTANNKGSGYGYVDSGITGVTVRTLLELAREFAEA